MNELQERYLRAKRALFDSYYRNLNPEQREAVYTVNGPLLILAGAGSGKTTVLVNRIAYIIKYGNAYKSDLTPPDLSPSHVEELESAVSLSPDEIAPYLSEFTTRACPPWQMLAITFTNKAANEIKERLSSILGDESLSNDIWAGTFHSICMRILRRDGEAVGCLPGFGVCDADDAKKVVTECIKELHYDEKRLTPKTVLNEISRAKDELLTPDDYRAKKGGDVKYRQIADVYERYQNRLSASNLVDFDDIIMKVVTLLRQDETIRDRYGCKFRYVCVDEYQDTNKAQFELMRLLSSVSGNVMVVGDDDQSIYRFRGATIENILGFDKTYTEASVIRLEQNYRSTKTILDAANGVIRNNNGRHAKKLWCEGAQGDKIVIRELADPIGEAIFIAERIARLKAFGLSYRDFAVLYRVNAQSERLEKAFTKSGIPYRMLGALRFYDRKEIRDVIAYLCVLNNPQDNVHLKRIYNEPKRKIGEASFNAAEQMAEALGVPTLEVMAHAQDYAAIPRAAAAAMMQFAETMRVLREAQANMPLADFVRRVIEDTGYRDMLLAGGKEERERVENVDELVSSVAEYEAETEDASLGGFLEDAALVSDVDRYDETADAVVLMTIHSAKGLEFPVVFLPGMEEGLFPSAQSLNSPEEIEEERRLAYVAITRAKKLLTITHVTTRSLYGQTQFNRVSRFVDEIPAALCDVQSAFSSGSRSSYRPSAPTAPSARSSAPAASSYFSRPATQEKPAAPTYAIGDRVKHTAFGFGTVLSANPMGGDTLYEIAFDDVGTKKIMGNYVARLMKKC